MFPSTKAAGKMILIALWSVCLSRASAADAFFSPDGKTVTLALSGWKNYAPDGKTVTSIVPSRLGTVDVETGKYTSIALTKELKEAEIRSLARGGEGEIFLLAKDAVWVLKVQEPAREVCKTVLEEVIGSSEKGQEPTYKTIPLEDVTDLVVVTQKDSPSKDVIMISAREKPGEPDGRNTKPMLYRRWPGRQDFVLTRSRRAPEVSSGTFTSDGRFFFVCEGDIWEGDDVSVYLTAARVAPLAILSTDMSNAGAMWADEVTTAGKWIYALLHGHHMGAIVRTPMPSQPDGGKMPSVTQQYQLMSEALAKAEVLTENIDIYDNFCVCEIAGKPRIFFRDRSKLMLLEGKGQPKLIGNLPEE
jgi:hypothetical protein